MILIPNSINFVKVLKLAVLALFLAAPQISTAATTYYVNGSAGNDSNPGTQSSPWKTIQKAANTMVAGDKVIVNGGTYNERVNETTSGSAGNTIIYQVNTGNTVTCKGFTISGSYITVDGFKVDADANDSTTGRGFYVSGDYVTIKNCYVTECPWGGIFLNQNSSYGYIFNNRCYHNGQNGIEVWGSHHLIENNEVWESVQYHPQGGPSSGADADGMRFHGDNHTFRGNWIHEPALMSDPYNSDPHIDCFQTYTTAPNKLAGSYCTFEKNHCRHYVSGMFTFMIEGSQSYPAHHITIKNNLFEVGSGIALPSGYYTHDIYIYNNTFIGDPSLGAGYAITVRSIDTVQLKNNITTNYKGGHRYVENGTNIVVDYNCAYNTDGSNPSATPGPQSHEQWAKDPKFVNLAGRNFHLQSSSPCIDVGTSVSQVNDDYDSESRPQGPAFDIGADEYAGTTSTLTASASASPTSGQTPLAVSFSGSASGGTSPYSYRWTFGDGGSSTSQNPSHTYSSASTYTAMLTVTDNASATASKSVTITVTSATQPLAATASASPTSGQAPLAVSFAGNASGGTTPYSYRWTFGDGGSSTAQNPSHTYSSSGSYTATLTVTDNASATASKSVTITATSASSQVIATASASPTAGPAPLSVGFTGGASGGTSPYSYSWNFGDGTSSLSQNPGHVYTNLGDYVATLTVTDNTSASANATVNISVTSSTTAVLGLSAETGAPATGQGGTTNPTPGNHSYSIGTNVQVASIPNTDYRFSKWGGDVVEASMFSLTTTVALNGNKSLKATFCSKCGDVNGDLNITPSDAQMAFDIYLSKIADPTWCELENADVNSSGTKLVPSDCSGASRAAATTQQKMLFNETTFTIDSGFLTSAGDIVIPVIVESAAGIGAFGFDLAFPSDNWIYVGLEASDLTSHFNQLAGNVVSYRASGPVKSGASVPNGLFLRVGGYKTSVDITPAVGVLVTLVFRSRTGFVDPSEVSIIAAYDDLKNALIYAGNIVGLRNTEGRAEVSRPADRRQERPVKGKLEF
jgi:PKD repeat protein